MKQASRALALLLSVMLLGITTSRAQTYGGAVLDHDIMMPTDFATLSQTQVFGTARTMAMGGAFTSLGGDITSASINPAGLGMLTQEVVSFTPMVSTAKASTTSAPSWVGNSKSSFGFANLGATFNLQQRSSGSLISLTAAVTYNRLADYNTKSSFSSESFYDASSGDLVPSIIDVFSQQLYGAKIYPNSNDRMDYDNNPYYWLAQEAFKTYLLDPNDDNTDWGTNVIGGNASVLSSYSVEQSGRTDEYSFALGGNVGNYLYFGASVGIQEINQKTQYVYQEEYNYYDGESAPTGDDALYSNMWQETTLSGVGTNLKLGLTARPARAIRVGVAFHTPTYYSIARTYQTSTEAAILNGDEVTTYTTESPQFIDNYEYTWRYNTPAKLLAGFSFQVGNVGIISVDYERQWYNWIRVSNAPGDITTEEYRAIFSEDYKPTNTIRAGLEVKPLPNVALRVGGGTTSSMIANESLFYNSPVGTDSHYITCGIGVQFSATTSLDVAYQMYNQNYTSYRLFYTQQDGEFTTASKLFDTSLKRSFISATLTIRI